MSCPYGSLLNGVQSQEGGQKSAGKYGETPKKFLNSQKKLETIPKENNSIKYLKKYLAQK